MKSKDIGELDAQLSGSDLKINQSNALDAKVGLSVRNVREPLLMMLLNSDFSLFERRIYWWILAEYNKHPYVDDQIKTTFKISVQDLVKTILEGEIESDELHNRTSKISKRTQKGFADNYRYFQKVCLDIVNRKVAVDQLQGVDPNTRTIGWINLFQGALYKNGDVYIMVSPFIAGVMADLSKGYNKYQLKAALLMRSDEAQLMYVWCCRYLDTGWWDIDLLEFQNLIKQTSYERYSNFKQRVLAPAIQEVNNRSDIFIELKEIKEQRQVKRLRFIIKTFKQALADEDRENTNALIQEIQLLPLDVRIAKARSILQVMYPQLNPKLVNAILLSEQFLNKFIEVDSKIEAGVITIKNQNRSAYMAACLKEFSKKKNKPPLKITPNNKVAIDFEKKW